MRKRKFNSNRKLRNLCDIDEQCLETYAQKLCYTGNPCHKRNPGDYGLQPPAAPRPDKTLCDSTGIYRRADAEQLLREGLKRRLISAEDRHGMPSIIWAMTDTGIPVEARLDSSNGSYHGYPLQQNDPIARVIEDLWAERVDV